MRYDLVLQLTEGGFLLFPVELTESDLGELKGFRGIFSDETTRVARYAEKKNVHLGDPDTQQLLALRSPLLLLTLLKSRLRQRPHWVQLCCALQTREHCHWWLRICSAFPEGLRICSPLEEKMLAPASENGFAGSEADIDGEIELVLNQLGPMK